MATVGVPKGPLCREAFPNQAERSLRDATGHLHVYRTLKRPANETGPFGTERRDSLALGERPGGTGATPENLILDR